MLLLGNKFALFALFNRLERGVRLSGGRIAVEVCYIMLLALHSEMV
jgi:hypothetical protein